MEGIEIKVKGHPARIERITTGAEELVVTVKFLEDDHPYNLISFGVFIPARHYTKEEFITKVTRGAETKLDECREEQLRNQKIHRKSQELEKLASEVSKDVGLG